MVLVYSFVSLTGGFILMYLLWYKIDNVLDNHTGISSQKVISITKIIAVVSMLLEFINMIISTLSIIKGVK